MIRAHKGKGISVLTYAEAVGVLLSELVRAGAEPSAWLSSLPVRIDGRELVRFEGDGEDFKKLQRLYFDIGPKFWKATDNPSVVRDIIKDLLQLDRPIAVSKMTPQEICEAIQQALMMELKGMSARILFAN